MTKQSLCLRGSVFVSWRGLSCTSMKTKLILDRYQASTVPFSTLMYDICAFVLKRPRAVSATSPFLPPQFRFKMQRTNKEEKESALPWNKEQ